MSAATSRSCCVTGAQPNYCGTRTNAACVEVAVDSGVWALVRDTKDRGGSVLTFRPNAWERFAQRVKASNLLT